jgi:hypothetical protein
VERGRGERSLFEGTTAVSVGLGRLEVTDRPEAHHENLPLESRIVISDGCCRVICPTGNADHAPLLPVDIGDGDFRAHDVVSADRRHRPSRLAMGGTD